MRAAAALSEHPLATHAVGESVGHLLDRCGTAPDVVLVWTASALAGALDDIAAATRSLLSPGLLVGCSADAVLAGERQAEVGPAIALLGLWDVGDVSPIRLDRHGEGFDRNASGTAFVMLSPHGPDPDDLVARSAEQRPELALCGGRVSVRAASTRYRSVIDGTFHHDGGVGLRFGPEVPVSLATSQGCRPIGAPLTVTESSDSVIRTIAGAAAADRLRESLGEDPVDQVSAAERGVWLGISTRPAAEDPVPGSFLVRPVLGIDRETGALATTVEVPVGATVQFHLSDPAGARTDLAAVLADRRAVAGIACTGVGRAAAAQGVPDRDATAIVDLAGPLALAGLGTDVEIGPVEGTVHTHRDSIALLLLG